MKILHDLFEIIAPGEKRRKTRRRNMQRSSIKIVCELFCARLLRKSFFLRNEEDPFIFHPYIFTCGKFFITAQSFNNYFSQLTQKTKEKKTLKNRISSHDDLWSWLKRTWMKMKIIIKHSPSTRQISSSSGSTTTSSSISCFIFTCSGSISVEFSAVFLSACFSSRVFGLK